MTSGQADEALIALAGILVTEQNMEETLRQVLELACTALPGGDEGGITLLEADGPATVMATSDLALRVDNTQYDSASGGPCLEAYRRRQIIRIDSTASDPRWPEYVAMAAAHGIGSTLSVPLVVGGDGIGAMNIYCRREHGFTDTDQRLAASLGSCASVTLSNARTCIRAARLAEQLREALATRGVLNQAAGILIAQRHCTADKAFHLLAAAAQRNRLTVDEVAADLVERTSADGQPD